MDESTAVEFVHRGRIGLKHEVGMPESAKEATKISTGSINETKTDKLQKKDTIDGPKNVEEGSMTGQKDFEKSEADDGNGKRKAKHDKTKSRRSLRTSFKDVLDLVKGSDTSESMDVTSLNADSCERKENHVNMTDDEAVPSSYTPLHGSEKERPLPFRFSDSSLFSKSTAISISHLDASIEGNSKANTNDPVSIKNCPIEDVSENPAGSRIDHRDVRFNESAMESSETSSKSPDFIPSSQSQSDATPILKGVTLITPRRSTRNIKKTKKAEWHENANKSRARSKAKISSEELDRSEGDKSKSSAVIVEEAKKEDGSAKHSETEKIRDGKALQEEGVAKAMKTDTMNIISQKDLSFKTEPGDKKGPSVVPIDILLDDGCDHILMDIDGVSEAEESVAVKKALSKVNKLVEEDEGKNRRKEGKNEDCEEEKDDSGSENMNDEVLSGKEKDGKIDKGYVDDTEEARKSKEKRKDIGSVNKKNDVKIQNKENKDEGKQGLAARNTPKGTNSTSQKGSKNGGEEQKSKRRSSRAVKRNVPLQTNFTDKIDGNEKKPASIVRDISEEAVVISESDDTQNEKQAASYDVSEPVSLSKDEDIEREDIASHTKMIGSKANVGLPVDTEGKTSVNENSAIHVPQNRNQTASMCSQGKQIVDNDILQIDCVETATAGFIGNDPKKVKTSVKCKENTQFAFSSGSQLETKTEHSPAFLKTKLDVDSSFEDSLPLCDLRKLKKIGRSVTDEDFVSHASDKTNTKHVIDEFCKSFAKDELKNEDVEDENSNIFERIKRTKDELSKDVIKEGKTNKTDAEDGSYKKVKVRPSTRTLDVQNKRHSVSDPSKAHTVFEPTENQFKGVPIHEIEETGNDAKIQRISDNAEESVHKRKRVHFVDDLDCETIESIFNSPDSPIVNKKRPVPTEESFQVIEKVAVAVEDQSVPLDKDTRSVEEGEQVKEREQVKEGEQVKEEAGQPVTQVDQRNRRCSARIMNRSTNNEELSSNCMKPKEPLQTPLSFLQDLVVSSIPSTTVSNGGSPQFSPISGILKRKAGEQTDMSSPAKKVCIYIFLFTFSSN